MKFRSLTEIHINFTLLTDFTHKEGIKYSLSDKRTGSEVQNSIFSPLRGF
jgi:hypothetical protein